MKEELITIDKIKDTPAGGVLIGKSKEGQTIIPEDGSMGGFLIGNLHKENGIKAVNKSNGQPLEMQGNEVVITAPAVADQTKREFDGKMMTNRQILSKINSDGGGVSFAEGGEIPAKINTTDKEYSFEGRSINDIELAHHLGCNSTLKNGKQLFTHDDTIYDVAGIYKAIEYNEIDCNIQYVDTFAMKYDVYDKKYSENILPDFDNPQGLMVRMDDGREILIDGNHRMNNAYINGFDKIKVYYIDNCNDISNLVRKTGFKNGGELKELIAPNGKPSNLNAVQYNVVRTPEFKNWFGDWENDPKNSSKIVDSNGEPLVVYHGTKSDFNEFELSKTGQTDAGLLGKGFYFTPSKQQAEFFSLSEQYGYKGTPKVMEVFLVSKNPEIIDDSVFSDGTTLRDVHPNGITVKSAKAINKKLISKKFDGAVFKDGDDLLQFFVFNPNQIKLADGTNTTFNSYTNDIRYNEGGHLSKGMTLEDIAKLHDVSVYHIEKQLSKGLEVEKEHTSSLTSRIKIAKDHLVENPDYYTILEKAGLEKGGGLNSIIVYNEEYKDYRIKVATDKYGHPDNYILTIIKFENGDWVDVLIQDGHKTILEAVSSAQLIIDNNEFDDETFAKGGKIDLVKSSKQGDSPARDLNNYNDVLDIQEDGIVGNHQDFQDTPLGFKEGGEIINTDENKQITEVMNDTIDKNTKTITEVTSSRVYNWNEVPSIWKNTNKVKKVTWINNPYDKGLHSILEPFIGKDSLRPSATGIKFDSNGITATNLNILITLPYPNSKFNGIYKSDLSKKKDDGQVTIDGDFPNYEKVIRKYEDNTSSYKISIYKLLQYTKVAVKYSNKIAKGIVFKIGENKIGLNGEFLISTLTALLKLGHETAYFHYKEPKLSTIFSVKKEYELGSDEIALIMPIYLTEGAQERMQYLTRFGAEDIDYDRELSVYYDFANDEIHNSDGSVADFKMTYSNNVALSENDVKLLKKIAYSKIHTNIQRLVYIKDNVARAGNKERFISIKNVSLPDGLYQIEDNVLEATMTPLEDYPYLPKIYDYENAIEFTINSDVLEYYTDKLKLATSNDDLRPILKGICLEYSSDNRLYLTATDANVLLKIEITEYVSIPKYDFEAKYIINPEYLHAFLDNIENVKLKITSNKNATSIESSISDFYSENIAGNYVNYNAVIPYYLDRKVTINSDDIKKCLDGKTAKEYIKEADKRDLILVFNENDNLMISKVNYEIENKYYLSDINDIKQLCPIDVRSVDESYSYNGGSALIVMPSIALIPNSDFAFKKEILDKIVDIVSDGEIEMHCTEQNKAYLIPIPAISFNNTRKETKKKEQKPTKKEIEKAIQESAKLQASNEINEAIDVLKLLKESASKKEKKQIDEALEILEMLQDSSDEIFEEGGEVKPLDSDINYSSSSFGKTAIETPLDTFKNNDDEIIKTKLKEIKEMIGVSLESDDYFTGLKELNGKKYFNVMLNERISESKIYDKLLGLVKFGIISNVEPNGVKRLAIFL